MEQTETSAIFLTRTETVRQIEQTVHELFGAISELGERSAAAAKAMRQSMEARCLKCGTTLTGSELFLLAESPPTEPANTIRRLRQNRCAHEGCEFNLYKITFHSHADIDWAKLFSLIQKPLDVKPADAEVAVEAEEPDRSFPLLPPLKLVIRTSIFAGVIVSLFVFHQIHRGGTIPFFRVPEKFHVDIAPAGDTTHLAK